MPQIGSTVLKDKDAAKVYSIDWTAFLNGNTIASSQWIVSGPDQVLTTDSPSILAGNKQTQVRLSAGTVGKKYMVTNRVTLNGAPAEIEDRSFCVRVVEQ